MGRGLKPEKRRNNSRRCCSSAIDRPVASRGEGDSEPNNSPPLGLCNSQDGDQTMLATSSPMMNDMGHEKDDNRWRPISEANTMLNMPIFAKKPGRSKVVRDQDSKETGRKKRPNWGKTTRGRLKNLERLNVCLMKRPIYLSL